MVEDKCCKKCGLIFNNNNKFKFPKEFNILKDGSKSYYYKKTICIDCKLGDKGFDKMSSINKKIVQTIKEQTPCMDCGNRFPYYVMHFDHKHDKKFHVSQRYGISMEKLKEEMNKCDLVCANCHAERTYQRKTTNKLILK